MEKITKKIRVGLEEVVSYLPETVVKQEDMAYLDAYIPPGQEAMFRGPEEFRRLRDECAVEIMAETVTLKALDRAGLVPSDIDTIIAANIGGRRPFPMIGTYIHNKVKFSRETPVINIQNFCAGFVDGINLAWDLILGGRHQRVLVVVVTAETCKWGIDQTSPLAKNFGDGSAAAVVSSQNLKYEFLSYTNRIFGERYEHTYMDLLPVANPELMEKAGYKEERGIFLYNDGWIFDFDPVGENYALNGIRQSLVAANLTTDDLDLVFIHHPGEVIHDPWVKGGIKGGISAEKWIPVLEGWNTLGNCGNVDVAWGLAEFTESGRIPEDAIIALWTAGLGGHTPCMIIKRIG